MQIVLFLIHWLEQALTYLFTRNATKALSVLMVDFSCALKLAMPISVLSAIREASEHNITVKGGKFLEAMAEADTIVFDKTGTLTKAEPTVVDVVPFNKKADELITYCSMFGRTFSSFYGKSSSRCSKREKSCLMRKCIQR